VFPDARTGTGSPLAERQEAEEERDKEAASKLRGCKGLVGKHVEHFRLRGGSNRHHPEWRQQHRCRRQDEKRRQKTAGPRRLCLI
jgi:hypothetical protein